MPLQRDMLLNYDDLDQRHGNSMQHTGPSL